MNNEFLGEQVKERYIIDSKVGQGGMGLVYKAIDVEHNRDVAIKFQLNNDYTHQERFLREIEICKKISHQNIVSTYDAGLHKGKLFIVMEYVDGSNLANLIKTEKVIAIDRACNIVIGALEALEKANNLVVAHRDIKPENILLTKDNEVKVSDWGIAKYSSADFVSLTQGNIIGTPHYMAPEQVEGGEIDIRTDVYSLGIVFYYMLSGKYPFDVQPSKNMLAWLMNRINHAPDNLQEHNKVIPEALVEIINSMMAKDRDKRPFPDELKEKIKFFLRTNSNVKHRVDVDDQRQVSLIYDSKDNYFTKLLIKVLQYSDFDVFQCEYLSNEVETIVNGDFKDLIFITSENTDCYVPLIKNLVNSVEFKASSKAIIAKISKEQKNFIGSIDFSEDLLDGYTNLFVSLGKQFLERRKSERRSNDDRRTRGDRRDGNLEKRLRIGYWKKFRRLTDFSKFDKLELWRMRTQHYLTVALEEELQSYKVTKNSQEIKPELIARKTVGEFTKPASVADGPKSAVCVVETIADYIYKNYKVEAIDRREKQRREGNRRND